MCGGKSMLNKIWCFFIVVAIIFGLISGTYVDVNNSIFTGIEETVSLMISFIGTISFWNGIMNIIENTSLINKLKNILKPLIKIIFKDINLESEVGENIAMNMTSNILGLGNAATPCGLKAMEELQKENSNKESLSNNMLLFILINTASIQIIPTTIISIRTGLGSQNPSCIILGVWFSSIVAFVAMLVITKTYMKIKRRM